MDRSAVVRRASHVYLPFLRLLPRSSVELVKVLISPGRLLTLTPQVTATPTAAQANTNPAVTTAPGSQAAPTTRPPQSTRSPRHTQQRPSPAAASSRASIPRPCSRRRSRKRIQRSRRRGRALDTARRCLRRGRGCQRKRPDSVGLFLFLRRAEVERRAWDGTERGGWFG